MVIASPSPLNYEIWSRWITDVRPHLGLDKYVLFWKRFTIGTEEKLRRETKMADNFCSYTSKSPSNAYRTQPHWQKTIYIWQHWGHLQRERKVNRKISGISCLCSWTPYSGNRVSRELYDWCFLPNISFIYNFNGFLTIKVSDKNGNYFLRWKSSRCEKSS